MYSAFAIHCELPLENSLVSDIYSELSWRGLINQVTDEEHLPKWLNDGSRTAYVGFDPTADSLH